MTTAQDKLLAKVRKRLESRDDVRLVDIGTHDISGITSRVYEITRHWRESPWQPYSKTTQDTVAQAFAMDVWPTNDKPTAKQKAAIDDCAAFGILHAWIRKGDEDIQLLGPLPPS